MAQHDWLDKDFYKILGVKDDVSQKELQKTYRKLARTYHPDANPDDPKAEDRFKQISEAYDVLGDAEKRKEYDEVRKYGAGGGFGSGGFGGGGGGPFGGAGSGAGGHTFDPSDLSDLLGGMFGGGGRRRGGGASPGHGPMRGADLEAELHLDFEDSVSGLVTSVHLTSDAACSTCSGSGAAKGTTPQRCGKCSGRGVIDDNQGFFSFSQPCDSCGGRGKIITSPCATCRGSGVERKPRQVKVRIPAGVKDGQRIRLKGRGAPGRNGGPAGDLFVKVAVERHKLFERKGNNLHLELPVSFVEAALGANIKVPTLDGSTVTLKLPPGTRSGRKFRVKGRGVASGATPGDLMVNVVVAVPQKLNEPQKKAVEALGNVLTESPRSHLYREAD